MLLFYNTLKNLYEKSGKGAFFMVKYTLIIEYLSKGNNFSQVATLCGCSRTTVILQNRPKVNLANLIEPKMARK